MSGTRSETRHAWNKGFQFGITGTRTGTRANRYRKFQHEAWMSGKRFGEIVRANG